MQTLRTILLAALLAVGLVGTAAPILDATQGSSHSTVAIYAANEPTPTPEHPNAPIDCPGGC